MNFFVSVFIKQLLLFILQVGIFVTLISTGANQYFDYQQQQNKKHISELLSNHTQDDTDALIKQLQSRYQFEWLTFIYPDNQSSDSSQVQKQPNINSMTPQQFLVKLVNIQPKAAIAEHPNSPIKIEFILIYSVQIKMLVQLTQMVVMLLAVIALFNLLSTKMLFSRLLRKVSNDVSDNIAQLGQSLTAKTEIADLPSTLSPTLQSIDDAIGQLKTDIEQHLTQINTQAEQVKSDALIDELTGLPNRNRFMDFFEQRLKSKDLLNPQPIYGCLGVVRCSQLQEINQARGYQAGDKYVCDIVKLLSHCTGSFNNPKVFRLNGSDFAVVLPSVELKEAENFAATLQAKLNQYQRTAELDSAAYTGLTRYDSSKALGELLALTDTAISIAQTKQANSWHSQNQADINDNVSATYGNQSWRQVIENVIAEQRVSLLYQTIVPSNQNNRTFVEILTRFINQEGQTLPTSAFFAMAEKLDLVSELEKMIIEVALERIKARNPNKLNNEPSQQYIAINLTTRSAHDAQFNTWLERRLQKEPDIASRLCFEVSEFGLQQNIKDSKRFIDMAHRVGARVTVERFGVGLTSFKFFRELKPDHVKMDGSYTKDLDKDNNNQYFLRQIIDLAHRIGVHVFAETVETSDERDTLQKLFIDGLQGYFLAKPEEF